MHTHASRLYIQTRIPTHSAQMAALARVIIYLATRYGQQRTARHRTRVVAAVNHFEAKSDDVSGIRD